MLLKTTRTVLIIALVSAFCRLRFLQQMMLPCWYTLQLNSNRANYHFTLLATNFNYVSFARISVLRKWQGPLIALNSLVQIKKSLVRRWRNGCQCLCVFFITIISIKMLALWFFFIIILSYLKKKLSRCNKIINACLHSITRPSCLENIIW